MGAATTFDPSAMFSGVGADLLGWVIDTAPYCIPVFVGVIGITCVMTAIKLLTR